MTLYNEFYKELQSYWITEQPKKVLEILEEGLKRFPRHLAELLFEGIMACIELNLTDDALKLMKQADENDLWYPEELFPEAEMYQPYLKKWSAKRGAVGSAALEVGNDSGENMLALHGWGEDLHLFRRYFYSDDYEKRARIHYLQSSQRIGSVQYVWDNRKQAESDIIHYLNEVFKSSEVNCLSGFSQGGYLALDLVLKKRVFVENLVLLCPGEAEYTIDDMRTLSENKISVLLITGSTDHDHAYHTKLNDLLKEAGVYVDFQVVEGMGHWFPDDLDSRIDAFL